MYTIPSRSSSSLESAVSPLQTRRDSLFSNTFANSDEEGDGAYCNAMEVSIPPPVGAPGTPRRRFPRRNAFCHFQLVQDAVEAIIEDINAQGGERPQIPKTTNAMDSLIRPLRRKFDNSQQQDSEEEEDHRRIRRQVLHPPTPFPSPRKAARTIHQPNPSTNVLFSDNFTL
jgi:hypothetical protein